jgi:predicted enzyme related to lactoylglutathione lyase
MTMQKVQHIAIVVSGIEKVLLWYQSEFDVKLKYADQSWALLQFENNSLELVLPCQHPPHIAVARENAETYGAFKRHRGGSASAYIEDPWGNTIDIMKANREGSQK